jgi:hypothetical protein
MRFWATTRIIRGLIASSMPVPLDHDRDSRAARALLQLGGHDVELQAHRDRAERDDPGARLELAQEQHLVDQLADLLHLGPRALDELGHVLARQRRRLEQREQPREWCPQLVRDRGREAGGAPRTR